ncbi:TetR family transcriptional regulator [Tamilnaduibacter salinus]|uniref:TetR family transcriptional regulator n=1 Tax=Tamilnaduibacter salinus TaxID=1484056 RepID=A0A2A2I1Z3_9GAMM|nr:TetR/AcrR family transcriptional regulator [Tamilnaduibacter salinus]PAV25667.1 TetR family transcriptional regulator [Tamilnaduibacter salinus]PVY76361.1 TetR family transcriptional regulator [Tamilnaduibacter salinus]
MPYRETEKMRRRKAAARQRILEATRHCVAEGGFGQATISRVAREADVATGTVYRHFESKEALFAEVFRQATQREVDKVTEALAGDEPAPARLERALRRFAHRALRGPTIAWSLIAEPVDPKVERERLQYREAYAFQFRQAIDDGIRETSLPPQNADITATCLVGAIAESLVGPLAPAHRDRYTGLENAQQETLIEPIIRFCMQALTGRGGDNERT